MALRDQLRVLVVDDMSTSRGLLTQALDAMGVRQVATTDGGPGALQIIEKNPVHLVISDFNMPKMNGLQLLHALRVGARTKGVGFILITGKADRDNHRGRQVTGNEQLSQKAVSGRRAEGLYRNGGWAAVMTFFDRQPDPADNDIADANAPDLPLSRLLGNFADEISVASAVCINVEEIIADRLIEGAPVSDYVRTELQMSTA